MSTKTRKLSAGQSRPSAPTTGAQAAPDPQTEAQHAREMARAREQWLRALRAGQRPN